MNFVVKEVVAAHSFPAAIIRRGGSHLLRGLRL